MSMKILLVEDDQWFAETIDENLKTNGYKTKISPHAVAAINDIDDFQPDVIIMDLLLTGSTAFNLMNELQSHADLAKIPIVICSNLSAQLKLKDLKPYGAKALLDKTSMKPGDIITEINVIKNREENE